MRSLDLSAITALGRWQSEAGLSGGLAEIGVHHGRLFLAMAALRRPGEALVAIDLFEDDDLNRRSRHAGRATALARHARRLSIPLDGAKILKIDSAKVAPARLMAIAGPLRMVSIDGAHDYDAVVSDLDLAAQVLAEDGVIAVDDFSNGAWPEVRQATTDFLQRQAGVFGAFLLTPGKLYLARNGCLQQYEQVAGSNPALRRTRRHHVSLGGRDVLCLRWQWAERIWRRLLDLRGVPGQYWRSRASVLAAG